MVPVELAMCGVRATAGEAQSILGTRRGAHGVGILEDADARGKSVMRSRAWLSKKSLARVIPCCLPSDCVLRRCDFLYRASLLRPALRLRKHLCGTSPCSPAVVAWFWFPCSEE